MVGFLYPPPSGRFLQKTYARHGSKTSNARIADGIFYAPTAEGISNARMAERTGKILKRKVPGWCSQVHD
jgi:hypothetical protein